MSNEYRCIHSRSPEEQECVSIEPDTLLNGVVTCQHSYGMGVYVPARDVWGHVNVTAMGVERGIVEFEDHPEIGRHLRLRVLGRSNGQLRLRIA